MASRKGGEPVLPTLRLPAGRPCLEPALAGLPEGELKGAVARLAKLYDVGDAILSADSSDKVFGAFVGAVTELFDVDRAFVATLAPSGDLVPRATHNIDLIPGDEWPVSRTMLREVLESGEPLLALDAQADPRFADVRSVGAHGMRSVMCAPIGGKPRPLGVLYADHKEHARAFDEQALRFLHALAHYAYGTSRQGCVCGPLPGIRRRSIPSP